MIYVLIGLAFILAAVLVTTLICFHIGFYAPRKPLPETPEEIIPAGQSYDVFRDEMIRFVKEVRAMPYEDVSITSFDGLKLYGKYYEYAPGASLEILFHGYRGNAERDMSGGVQRCFALGRNALIVDQRTSGRSEGNVISFGVNESRDCAQWVDFCIRRFGKDVKIIITGISMGAATVVMATARGLPENVVGVLADCGYSTQKDIIMKTIRMMKLPPKLMYPFAKLAARIFGHFDLEEISPLEALKTCKIPVIFIHGEADDFVPCEMSRINYEACASPKALVVVPGADHGLSYLVDPQGYLQALADFWTANGLPTQIVKE